MQNKKKNKLNVIVEMIVTKPDLKRYKNHLGVRLQRVTWL